MTDQAGARIIATLEATWKTIQKHHAEVPDVVIVTGSGQPTGRRKGVKWGHHTVDRWLDAAEAGKKAELFVSGEAIAKGGEKVVETMLHEAAHALAAVRDIRDTSCAGRWHNKKFAALASELGLEPPRRAQDVIGFSESLITAVTVGRYAASIRRLDAAALARIDLPEQARKPEPEQDEDNPGPRGGRGRAGKRVPVRCGCEPPRQMRATPAFLEGGAVLCGTCGEAFQPVEPEEQGERGELERTTL
ncbi:MULTISPECIES: hypothetical protein [unclassified Streptomyces]|uniref:hypothetical protein n=1 Tax=unclassified Streptomyces TaxID=2593676 RepID=UPI00278BE2F2|nr:MULTISPECIES: hypothetical protein [unclassified Streptomyces]